MAWKLDNIDFKTFGVGVAKSSGVLDMPQMVDASTDWLDINGKDYWQAASDVKYKDRDISLDCWIKAAGYVDFKAKVASFYAALIAPGERTLLTPFGTIEQVTVQQSIVMVRKTQYVSSLQIGMFTLRLTVAGDSQTKLLTVYNSAGAVRAVVKYGADAKISRALQGSSDISFSSEFNSIQDLGRGDYIVYEGEKYISLEYPQIDKISTNKFIYRFNYTHEFFLLKDIQFRVIDRSSTPYWTDMDGVVDLVITNANRAYPGVFVKGTIDVTENRNHQFTNESCYDVLQRISGEYELEYEYKQLIGGTIQLNVVKQIGTATGDTFEYGKNNTLYKLSRVSSGRDKMVTRLYSDGSDKNIPVWYGYPKLRLAVEPLTRDFYGMHIERTISFPDIFPERTGTVDSYTHTVADPVENSTYVIVDSTMDFDLNGTGPYGTKYLIEGKNAKIHFNSGDLAGFEFEILSYNHATKAFSLIPYKDERGTMYPNATLHPAATDTYKILDINVPESYVTDAVNRLSVAMNAYIDENYSPKLTCTVETNPFYNLDYFPGDTVTLIDTDFALNTSMKVAEITRNLYQGGANITLSSYVQKSKRLEMSLKVASLERAVSAAKLDQVEVVRANEIPTVTLKNQLINPIDEQLKADELVRSESIDPRMLSYDAGIIQFYIKDAMLETNVDGDEDKIHIEAGEISITNWRNATKKRAEIESGYDPTRTWIIPATSFTLATKALHFIYAKVNLADGSTACVIEVSTAHREIKSEAGYLIYKLGFISTGEEIA